MGEGDQATEDWGARPTGKGAGPVRTVGTLSSELSWAEGGMQSHCRERRTQSPIGVSSLQKTACFGGTLLELHVG